MSLEHYLSRNVALIQFIQQKPSRLELITWMHKNISMPGYEPAVCFFELVDDEKIIPRNIVGFDDRTLEQLPSVRLEENRPVSNVLREMKLVVYGEAELASQNLQLVKGRSDLSYRNSEVSKWKSAVGIPIGANKGYSILFQIDITQYEFALENLKILESLLNAYESLVHSALPVESKNEIFGKSLTKRQEEIVTLIKLGKTNFQIAFDLGYSESLIRQETITIYKKLGISGRKELNIKSQIANI